MGKKLFTVLVILAVAAFIYYNKGSFVEKYRTRKNVENRLEELTGADVDLKKFFKGLEGLDREIDKLDEDKIRDLRDRLEALTAEEREILTGLLDEKGDELEAFLNDVVGVEE